LTGELTQEIAAGATDSTAIVKSLYEWVSANISCAGNCIGLGAVVPRDLDVRPRPPHGRL